MYLEIEGADHGNEYADASQQIADWFAARLTGTPPVDSRPNP